MRIRLAGEVDLAAVTTLYHEVSDAMIGSPYDCSWRRDMHPSDPFIARLVRDGGMFIAEDEDVIIAAVGIDHDLGHDYGSLSWQVDVPEDEVAVIHLLTVAPAWRGGGVSRVLLRTCLDEARARGMRTARLDATSNNAPAIALYESEGFKRIGYGVQEVGPDDNPFVSFVVMELVL